MSILEKINSPEDMKNLNKEELYALAYEIRQFLIDNVSKTGGHLGANLGIVETTIAIHKVFDTSRDRLVFDVGHQCYVHKILTGRKDSFDTLRKFGGIAGFPKPCESEHDAFIAGHASNSVSVALGMARARTIRGEDYSVVALIGDGALTGGTAYEGLSDAGDSGEPMIVILNDNRMAIDFNVGGIARSLAHQRLKPGYMKFKRAYRSVVSKVPIFRGPHKVLHKVKTAVKEAFLPCSMFEEMGFEYLGPVNGHDINMMIYVLSLAKSMNKPVLIHAITKKGKGYSFAEADPSRYHSVPPFNKNEGVQKREDKDFSAAFGEKLSSLADEDSRICTITAAMGRSTGLGPFYRKHPDRFFDVGIAEEHAAAMCAGMAKEGAIPVFAVYSTFLQRSYDMLIHDVAISNLHAVFAVDRAGLVGADGETHHGVFDVSYISSVPNFKIYAPASFQETEDMLEKAIKQDNCPVAIRYPRGKEGRYIDGGCDSSKIIREGRDFTIITYGISVNTALDVAEILEAKGIDIEIVKLGRIWPVDYSHIIPSLEKTNRVLFLEETVMSGCIGEKVSCEILKRSIPLKSVLYKNLGHGFVQHGDIKSLYKLCGIDAESVALAIAEEFEK